MGMRSSGSHAVALGLTLLGLACPSVADARSSKTVAYGAYPSIGQFAVLPDRLVIMTTPVPGAPGPTFTLRSDGAGHEQVASSAGFTPFSISPIETAVDPRRNVGRKLVYSQCLPGVGIGAGPTCGLFVHDLAPSSPATTADIPATDQSPAGMRDTHPSVYQDATLFVRSALTGGSGQLRFAPSFTAPSSLLAAGPTGIKTSTATGTALRGRDAAYVWTWTDKSGTDRNALRIMRIGRSPRTVVSMPVKRGRIVGPAWQGQRLVFVVRRSSGTSRWYRFDPAKRTFQSARGADHIGSIATTPEWPALYWQQADAKALRTGLCPSSCRLYLKAPAFSRSRKPS
jgi:hypothetical protein